MNGPQPIKIAILAMGGEGGGVLADWLVDLGESNGYLAQTTSVPGVAQRTGATIYYVELFPEAAARAAGARPVLALMPLPGDVDLVLASELMEAARAVQRGLVTPARTTLVCSTHRVYAIAEKMALGDGRADAQALRAQAEGAAQRFIGWDMAQAADDAHSVISAVLFGALAGCAALPFARAQFEATIGRGGVGVGPSLAAFGAAFDRATRGAAADSSPAAAVPLPATAAHPAGQALLDRAQSSFGGELLAMVLEGLRRSVDYQDPAYAGLYLDRLDKLAALSPGANADGGDKHTANAETSAVMLDTARHLALWMSYEDTIRVADLKTRDARFARVRSEVGVSSGQVLAINEYMHPRLQEIADTLPAAVGRWLLASGLPRRLVGRLAAKGRVVQTSSLRGYLMLWLVAGLRRWRRGTLRYAAENARIEAWLADIGQALHRGDSALALEIARCQRLVKGYGDTHERGLRNYDLLRHTWLRPAGRVGAAGLAALRDAALADEHGHALAAALKTLHAQAT